MRRFSFGTFLVDDGNRALYETCRSIASLSYRGRLPVLLIAPEGYGKTHLLYSIVNRARSGPAKTGVAFVSADEFPVDVRRLTRNPGPVERARNAILLVDDLHRFTEHLGELDQLVDLFLKHGHYVVLTSAVPINALNHLPAALRRRLERGHAFATQVSTRSASTNESESSEMRETVETVAGETLRLEAERARAALAKAEQELEQLRGENALLKVSAREVGLLRKQVESLEDRLEDAGFAGPLPQEHPGRQQAGAVLEKAAALLEEVQENRSRLAKMREQTRGLDIPNPAPTPVDEREQSEPADDASRIDAATERDRLVSERAQLEREVENLRKSVARANEERDETRRHLRAAFEKLDRYEKNLADLRGQVEQYSTDQDEVLEQRMHALSESTRLDTASVAEGLRDVQAQFAAGLRMIDRMADQLDALCVAMGGAEPPEVPAAETEPFFVTPAEEGPASGTGAEMLSKQEEPQFVPGIGTRNKSDADSEPLQPAAPIRRNDDWTPRRSLHHVEELSEPGLFSYRDDYDTSI